MESYWAYLSEKTITYSLVMGAVILAKLKMGGNALSPLLELKVSVTELRK